MKVIIAGSRDIDIGPDIIASVVHMSGFDVTEVVSGAARGIDTIGEMWAKFNKIPTKRFPADWDRYGKSAGYKRNVEMAEYADALIAIWNGWSKGTKHMIDIAKEKNLKVFVFEA